MTVSNNLRYRQRGMTVFGGFIMFLLIAAIALLIVRISPAYIEDYTVKRVLGDLLEDDAMAHKSPQEISNRIRTGLRGSGIHDLKGKKIQVKRAGGVTHVSVDYVVKKPIVGNIDVLITFSNSVELVKR